MLAARRLVEAAGLRNLRSSGYNAIPELRVQITPSRFRVADLVILQGRRKARGVLNIAPLAIVEVLSPEDRMSRIQTRMDDYLSLGIRYCWLVDPEARRAWRYTDAGSFELRDLILRAENPDFSIPLSEIFAEMGQADGRIALERIARGETNAHHGGPLQINLVDQGCCGVPPSPMWFQTRCGRSRMQSPMLIGNAR